MQQVAHRGKSSSKERVRNVPIYFYDASTKILNIFWHDWLALQSVPVRADD